MALDRKRFAVFLRDIVICRIVLVTGFLIATLFIYVIQLIGYLAIRPWSRRIFRKMESCVFSDFGLNYFAFLLQWWSDSKIELIGDPSVFGKFGKENALIIFNHKYEIDFIAIYNLASYFGALGSLKWFVKKSVAHVPVIGPIMNVHENIFLERDWEKDRDTLGLQLTEFLDQPEPRIFALFPEGTRFTPDKHIMSMAVAKDKGFSELKHHLLPRTRGFVECMKIFRRPGFQQVAIYDGFVAVSGNNEGDFSFLNILKGKGVNIKIFVKRYVINEIPSEDMECANWIHKRFLEKDRMMENFLRSGNMMGGDEDEESFEDFQVIQMHPQISVVSKFIVWNCLILGVLGVIVWKLCLALGTELMGIMIMAGFCLGYLGVVYLDNKIKIEKSSSYGS